MTRINRHPILGEIEKSKEVEIIVDGVKMSAYEGEMIATALTAKGIKVFRYTKRHDKPRGIYCGIGRCTDCVMTVNGVPNVRTCITPIEDGMVIETQRGVGNWKGSAGNE